MLTTQNVAGTGQEVSYLFLQESFTLLKSGKLPISTFLNGQCLACKERPTLGLSSEPWTSAEYCPQCQGINMILHQDPMSGALEDVLVCYVAKTH